MRSLPGLLEKNRIVYAGFSAAAVIASSDLKGITPSPASYEPLEGYEPGLVWDGLGIISPMIVVHHESNHPGNVEAAEEAAYYQRNDIPYLRLRDGEALVIDGEDEFISGWPTDPA